MSRKVWLVWYRDLTNESYVWGAFANAEDADKEANRIQKAVARARKRLHEWVNSDGPGMDIDEPEWPASIDALKGGVRPEDICVKPLAVRGLK